MTEALGSNSPTLPEEGVSNGKEIPTRSLVEGILSIPIDTKKVEATRIALHYLLAEGRMVHSVDFLADIHAEKLPLHEGERNIMLKSILDTAEKKYREDPFDTYFATENVRYLSEGTNNNTFLTEEERRKFDKEALVNTSVIVTRRLIECMLNPSLPRGRYEKAADWSNMEDIISRADERGYFKNIYDSFSQEVRKQLDDKIPDNVKKKLGEIPTTGTGERPSSSSQLESEKPLRTGSVIEEIGKAEGAGENVNPPGPAEETTTGGNIINMEDIDLANLPKELNELLSLNKNESHFTFIFSPEQLKEYIASMAKGFDITGGNIIVGEDLLIIGGLRIAKSGVGVTLDLLLSNGKDGITADVTKFHRDVLARTNKASSREEVEKQIKAIDSAIKKRLDEETKATFGWFGWKTKKVSILDGRVRVEFEKLLAAEAATVRETLQSQVSVKEQKAKVEVIPISEEDFSRTVKLKIGERESGIIWDQRQHRGEPRKGEFHLKELRKEKGKLMLPNGTSLRIGKYILASNASVAIMITGGGNTAINIPDLVYFKDRDLNIDLLTNDSESWASEPELHDESGKCIFMHHIALGTEGETVTPGLSVKTAIALLKDSLEKAKT